MLGRGSEPELPLSHTDMRGNNRYTKNYPVLRQPFCLSLSVLYSTNYTRYPILYYKIGFVLHDFAQYSLM